MRYTNVRFTYILTTKYYVSSMHITMHSKVIRRTIDDRFVSESLRETVKRLTTSLTDVTTTTQK